MRCRRSRNCAVRSGTVTKEVVCDEHGTAYATFVCRHLLGGNALGFEQGEEDPEQARPDAWCAECERYRIEHDGWSDDVPPPAGIALVCHRCYDRIKAANEAA